MGAVAVGTSVPFMWEPKTYTVLPKMEWAELAWEEVVRVVRERSSEQSGAPIREMNKPHPRGRRKGDDLAGGDADTFLGMQWRAYQAACAQDHVVEASRQQTAAQPPLNIHPAYYRRLRKRYDPNPDGWPPTEPPPQALEAARQRAMHFVVRSAPLLAAGLGTFHALDLLDGRYDHMINLAALIHICARAVHQAIA